MTGRVPDDAYTLRTTPTVRRALTETFPRPWPPRPMSGGQGVRMLPGDEVLTVIVDNNVMPLIAPHRGPAKPRRCLSRQIRRRSGGTMKAPRYVRGAFTWGCDRRLTQLSGSLTALTSAPSQLTETIEFSVAYPTEKRLPLVRRKPQDQALSVLAVADTYLTARQVRHLNAIAVGETQGALHPVRAAARPPQAVPKRRSSHVRTSWMWCDGWPPMPSGAEAAGQVLDAPLLITGGIVDIWGPMVKGDYCGHGPSEGVMGLAVLVAAGREILGAMAALTLPGRRP